MPSIMVEPYVIRVRKKFDRKNKSDFKLDAYGDGEDDLFDVLKRYLSGFRNKALPIGMDKAVKVTSYHNNNRVIKGRLSIGDYGTSSQIVNVSTGNDSYLKKKDDADLIPYYFALHVPKNKFVGVALLQRIGKGGVRSALEDMVEVPFRDEYGDTNLTINALAPEDALKDALRNEIREVTFIQHSIPGDLADKIISPSAKSRGKFAVTVQTSEHAMPKVNRWIRKKINGKSEFGDIIEIDDFDPDTIKATFSIGGKERVLEISDKVRFKPSFDISEDVDVGLDGYAKFGSIDSACTRIADSLLKSLN